MHICCTYFSVSVFNLKTEKNGVPWLMTPITNAGTSLLPAHAGSQVFSNNRVGYELLLPVQYSLAIITYAIYGTLNTSTLPWLKLLMQMSSPLSTTA